MGSFKFGAGYCVRKTSLVAETTLNFVGARTRIEGSALIVRFRLGVRDKTPTCIYI